MIDVTTIQQLLVTAVFIVPITIGLTQVIKTAMPAIDSRFGPLLSLVIGIALGIFIIGGAHGFLAGLIFGLAASGSYDLGKKTIAGA